MAYDLSKSPAVWVKTQAARRERVIWSLIVLTFIIFVAVIWVSVELHEPLLTLPLLVAVFALRRLVHRRIPDAVNWILGANSESAVGYTLNELPQPSFRVMHDLRQAGEGNIDHLVAGPTGVFLIETKHRRYLDRDLTKVKRQAAKVNRELGVWVTPVICIDHRPKGGSFHTKGVTVVRREGVCAWLQPQSNQPVEFNRLAAWADRL
jgi:hypothetical protein